MPDPDIRQAFDAAMGILRRGGYLRVSIPPDGFREPAFCLFDSNGSPQSSFPFQALTAVFHRPELFKTDQGRTPTLIWARWELPRALQEPAP